MVHEDYKELLAAKALTALDAEDTRALEIHLQTCADCRAELIEWEQTAAFLALDAAAQEPSPELRQRILLSVGRMEAEGQLDQQRASPSDESRVLTFGRPRSSIFSLRPVGAIAAALVVATLLASLIMLWQQNRSARDELAKLSTQLEETKSQLAKDREVRELLSSPGTRMAALSGTSVAPAAHAMIAYDKNGRAMLMAKGLPAAPPGKAYQLWFIMGGKPMPGSVFTTDPQGSGSLKDQVPAEALSGAVFAITLEPAGGVQSPTGAIYLRSEV